MHDEVLQSHHNIILWSGTTVLLCSILIAQSKYAEARKTLSPCLDKARRVLGPTHSYTKGMQDLDIHIILRVTKLS